MSRLLQVTASDLIRLTVNEARFKHLIAWILDRPPGTSLAPPFLGGRGARNWSQAPCCSDVDAVFIDAVTLSSWECALGWHPLHVRNECYTTPTTTVARRLHSVSPTSPIQPNTPSSKLSSPPSAAPPVPPTPPEPPCAGFRFVKYSSDLSADDFHPHDCETVKLSGADAKRMSAVPSADEQQIEKYACG